MHVDVGDVRAFPADPLLDRACLLVCGNELRVRIEREREKEDDAVTGLQHA